MYAWYLQENFVSLISFYIQWMDRVIIVTHWPIAGNMPVMSSKYMSLVYPYTLQNLSCCFCQLSYHQQTQGTQFHWQPYMLCHVITVLPPPCLTDEVDLQITSCSIPSLYSALPIILVLVDLSKKYCSRTGQAFLVNSGIHILDTYQWFASWGKTSVFTFMKSSV